MGSWSAGVRAMSVVLAMPALAAAQTTLSDLHEKARVEKKVVFWGSPDVKVFQSMHAAFSRKYPGLELEMSKVQAAPAIDRLISTKNAGRNDVDLLDTPLGYMPLLLGRGLADPFDWTGTFGIDREKVLYDGRAVVGWHIDMPIAFNTNVAKTGDIKSWDDLLDPKWRGKLLVEKRGLAFAVLALNWGEEKTAAFLRALKANEPIITVGSSATIEALAGGQGAVAVGAYGGPVLKAKAEGAPVDVALVGPVPAMIEAAVMVKDAPHPKATRLWIDFLTTPAAQAMLYEGQGLGLVHGAGLSPQGELYRKAALDVILESTDAALMQKLLGLVSSGITGRR